MKVNDSIRKCVAFLAYMTKAGDTRLAGTAFLAAEPIADTSAHFQWVVTAAHVINGIRVRSTDGIVRIRLTSKEGPPLWYTLSVDDWHLHPTDDVAAASVDLGADPRFDFLRWPLEDSDTVTEATVETEAIGVGDDLYFPGLFVHHAGMERNIPIVRTGTIAAMPGEPLRVKYWGGMVAYLVETRSIGGLSGSPVFVHLGFLRTQDGQVQFFKGKHGRHLFLGIMSGHYPGELAEADVALPSATPDAGFGDEELQINMGIGIVVPALRVLEIIKRPEFDAVKAKHREAILDQGRGAEVSQTADVPLPEAEDGLATT